MRLRSSLFLGSSLALALASCGGGGADRPGLIISKSTFGDDYSTRPATLVLLRPPADAAEGDEPVEWEEEVITAAPELVELQTGRYEGELVFRRLDESGAPTGPAVELQARGKQWAVADRVDVPVDEVDWDTRGDAPATKEYYIAGGNVFHKAMWWEPAYGEPGILTISANMPYLQIWREQLGTWEPETLWTAQVGEKEQRFRDVELGDVDGDGADELVVVTHDLGAVFVLEQTPEGLEAQELHRLDERTFVHEVEICDVDGDGALEFFTTPSEPNKLGEGSDEQSGGVDMYRYDAGTGSYTRRSMVHWEDRHAKEILGYDYDGDGAAEIYAAAERKEDGVEKVAVEVYRWNGSAMELADTIELDGEMCRFLSGGEIDGDGVREIVASTKTGGVFALSRDDQGWKVDKVVAGFISGGFEHATALFDWDGDGVDDVFICNDDKERVQRVFHNPESGRYQRETLVDLKGRGEFISWNVMELPPGR